MFLIYLEISYPRQCAYVGHGPGSTAPGVYCDNSIGNIRPDHCRVISQEMYGLGLLVLYEARIGLIRHVRWQVRPCCILLAGAGEQEYPRLVWPVFSRFKNLVTSTDLFMAPGAILVADWVCRILKLRSWMVPFSILESRRYSCEIDIPSLHHIGGQGWCSYL